MLLFMITTLQNQSKNANSVEGMVQNDLPILIADYELTTTIHARLAAARGYLMNGEEHFKEQFDTYVDIASTNAEIIL